MAEEADDSLDRLLHTVEVGELGIHLDRTVHKDTPQARLLARIDHDGLADRAQHPLGCPGIVGRLIGAFTEVILYREFDLSPVLVQPRIKSEDPIVKSHLSHLNRCPLSTRITLSLERQVAADVSSVLCN